MTLSQTADLIQRWAERLGYSVDQCWAQTGTIYLECCRGETSRKIRVADHGECYCTEDLSVDPDGCSRAQAVRFLASEIHAKCPAWAARAIAQAEAKKVSDAKRAADWNAANVAAVAKHLATVNANWQALSADECQVWAAIEDEAYDLKNTKSGRKARKERLGRAGLR